MVTNLTTGDKTFFAKAGWSFGVGVAGGAELSQQAGSFEGAMGLPEGSRQTAGEFELDSSWPLGGNVVFDDVGNLTGGGVNAG